VDGGALSGIYTVNDSATIEVYTLSLHDALPILTFAVTVEGKPVEADVYVNNQKINSDKHVFTNAGDYEVIAKKNNYKDSDKIIIEVYKIDVYVSGTQNTTANITSTTQALVWKNGELLHELTNGTAFATTAGIALHNDDVYVGGTETSGLNRV